MDDRGSAEAQRLHSYHCAGCAECVTPVDVTTFGSTERETLDPLTGIVTAEAFGPGEDYEGREVER